MLELLAKTREEVGKNRAKKLRKDGWIPGVIYGHGENPVNIKVKKEDLIRIIHSLPSEATIVNVKIGKKIYPALFQEVTRDILTDKLLHVDFHIIHKGEKLRVKVPVEVVGESKGVKEGGIVDFIVRELEVSCLPKHIPEKITVDITDLDIGDSIHIGDIDTEDKFTIEGNADQSIVTIVLPKKLEVAAPVEEEVIEEEITEPEVISKEKEEEKEGEEQEEEKKS
ncbi:50S ribosomal protein L25 [candidate division WOR-3 bacterium]|nr:50S ribosomal protein L25 [candidate division WOR-3 bacterium]